MKRILLVVLCCIGLCSVSYSQSNEFYFNGFADVILRYPLRGSGGRAIVHYEGNVLSLNYGGDFTGGVRLGHDFHVLNDGRTGIGLTNPSEKLEILNGFFKSGHASFGFNQETNSGPVNYLTLGADNHASILLGSNLCISSNPYSTIKISETHQTMSGSGIFIPGHGQLNQGAIIFHTSVPGPVVAGQAYSSPQVIINQHGDLGIGTLSPAERLSVNGNIRAREIKVEAVNWPDYVFSPSHSKPSLPELEAFIKENNHLPEIPSSDQIGEEGINLGEMNVKLLKKIEELTLYLIEKDQEVKDLQKRMEQIEKKTDKNDEKN